MPEGLHHQRAKWGVITPAVATPCSTSFQFCTEPRAVATGSKHSSQFVKFARLNAGSGRYRSRFCTTCHSFFAGQCDECRWNYMSSGFESRWLQTHIWGHSSMEERAFHQPLSSHCILFLTDHGFVFESLLPLVK